MNRWQVVYRDVRGDVMRRSPHWFKFAAEAELKGMKHQAELSLLRYGMPVMYSMSVERTSRA